MFSVDPSVPVACPQQLRHRRMEYMNPSSLPTHLGQSDKLDYMAEHETSLGSRPGNGAVDTRPDNAHAPRTSTLGPERGACSLSPGWNVSRTNLTARFFSSFYVLFDFYYNIVVHDSQVALRCCPRRRECTSRCATVSMALILRRL